MTDSSLITSLRKCKQPRHGGGYNRYWVAAVYPREAHLPPLRRVFRFGWSARRWIARTVKKIEGSTDAQA